MTNQRKQKEEMNCSFYSIWKHDWCWGIYFSRWGSWIIMRTSFSSLWEEGWQGHPREWESEGSRMMTRVMSSASIRPTEVPWDMRFSKSPSPSHRIGVRARSNLSKHLVEPSHLQSSGVNCPCVRLISGITTASALTPPNLAHSPLGRGLPTPGRFEEITLWREAQSKKKLR